MRTDVPDERDSPDILQTVNPLAAGELTAVDLEGIAPLHGGRTVENMLSNQLRESILDGTLSPGLRLPYRDLAQRFGVSVTPVRIALKQLSAEGLVEMRPHSGARVTPLSIEEIEELILTRIGIEPWLALRGAKAISDAAVDEMSTALAELRAAVEAVDAERYLAGSWGMRMPLYKAARRPRLLERLSMLYQGSVRYHLVNIADSQRLHRSSTYYEKIFEAVVRRDGKAAQKVTRESLEWTLEYLVQAMEDSTT